MLLQWDWSESGPTGEESLALLEMEEHLALLSIGELFALLDDDEHLALLEVPLEPPVPPVGVSTPAVVSGGGKGGVPWFLNLLQGQLGLEVVDHGLLVLDHRDEAAPVRVLTRASSER